MRYSKQRELVLQKVEQLCDHPTAEEIYDEAIKECPGLSLGTVYRNLNSLVDAGRVRRVCIPGKADRFDHTLCWHSHMYWFSVVEAMRVTVPSSIHSSRLCCCFLFRYWISSR